MSAPTDADLVDYAHRLIADHARDIEYLTIHEAWEGSGELTDEEAGRVAELIDRALVSIGWADL